MGKTADFTIRVNDNGTLRDISVNAGDLGRALSSAQAGAARLGTSLKGLAGAFGWAGALMTSVKVLKDGVATMAGFERSNSELASVLGRSAREVSNLSDAAMELGRRTEFTASQVTQLQIALARLGFDDSQILDMQEGILKFATAVGTDLGSAAEFTGSALRAFGLEASDTKDLLDVMSASTNKSALSFSKLETSISIVAPVANKFGLSAADTVAMLGALADAGFDASSASTAFRNILLNLADSNGKLATGLGHTAKTLPEIISGLRELSEKGVDLNEVLGMTDRRSAAAFATFLAGADKIEKLRGELGECTGTLETMSETMTDNLVGATRALSSAWEGFVLEFRQSTGVMKEGVLGLASAVNSLTDAMKRMRTGGKSRRSRKGESDFLEMFTGVGDESGREAMIAMYDEWLSDAEAAYNTAIGKYNNFKSSANRKAMMAAGEDFMNLSDIKGAVYGYKTGGAGGVNRAVTGSGVGDTGGTGKAADPSQIKSDMAAIAKLQLEVMTDAREKLTAEYNRNVALFKQYGVDISALTQKFQADLVKLDASEAGDVVSASEALDKELQASADKALSTMMKCWGVIPSAIDKSILEIERIGESAGGVIPELQGYLDSVQSNMNKKLTASLSVDTTGATDAIGALADVMSGLSGVVSESASSWLSWGANVIKAVAAAIPAIVQLTAQQSAQATANTVAAATGAASSVASTPAVGPALAVASMATVLAAILSTVSSIPKFASGGLAYGPTLGLFGEYAGAANNPEVVAPLSTLKTMISDAAGFRSGEVRFEIEGSKLVGVLSRYNSIRSRS